MRLAALLGDLASDQLELLAAEHLGHDEAIGRGALAVTLEGVLRSYSFVRKAICDRFPPTFSILELLLDAEGHSLAASTLREQVSVHAERLVEGVASCELVGRDSSLQLYRRVLMEVRRNDLILDPGEAAILGVLRRELSIRTVEHFLVEHHADFFEYWKKDYGFLHQVNALRSHGLLFAHDGFVILPDELVPLVRQVLGLEMSNASRRRLFEHFSGTDLAGVLGDCGLKTSGSRDERLGRVMASYVQPSEALRLIQLQAIRDIARESNASVSGSKDELVERLVTHFTHSRDLSTTSSDEAPPPPPQARVLEEKRFRALFASLRGDDLSDILAGIESSRLTGAKETKIELLFGSRFSENSLLEQLTNRALEEALARSRLRSGGSKLERADRLIEHFRTVPLVPEPSADALPLEGQHSTPHLGVSGTGNQ